MAFRPSDSALGVWATCLNESGVTEGRGDCSLHLSNRRFRALKPETAPAVWQGKQRLTFAPDPARHRTVIEVDRYCHFLVDFSFSLSLLLSGSFLMEACPHFLSVPQEAREMNE